MEKKQNIPIRIDYRETNSEIIRCLGKHPLFTIEKTHLTTGDYQLGRYLLMERKTWSDFSLSIIQGRLFRQAARMNQVVREDKVKAAVLVIEGQVNDYEAIRMHSEAITGAVASLMIRFHLPVFQTRTPQETIKLMEIIYSQLLITDSGSQRPFPPRWGKINRKSRRRNQDYILQGLPGIGSSRAADLLQYFGSVEAVFNASASELAKVEGIGPSTAERIRAIIT